MNSISILYQSVAMRHWLDIYNTSISTGQYSMSCQPKQADCKTILLILLCDLSFSACNNQSTCLLLHITLFILLAYLKKVLSPFLIVSFDLRMNVFPLPFFLLYIWKHPHPWTSTPVIVIFLGKSTMLSIQDCPVRKTVVAP